MELLAWLCVPLSLFVFSLFSVILCEFAAELGLTRPSQTIYNEPLLALIRLGRNPKNIIVSTKIIQLRFPPSEDAADCLRNSKVSVDRNQRGYFGC